MRLFDQAKVTALLSGPNASERGPSMGRRLFLSLAMVATLSCACLLGCSATASSDSRNDAPSSAAATQMADSQDTIEVSMEFDLSLLSGTQFVQEPMANSPSQVVTIPAGSTAYDALVATGAEVEGSPAYVSSINGIGEGQAGDASGWMYMVNGQVPTVAGNELVLQDGDRIKWYYGTWT